MSADPRRQHLIGDGLGPLRQALQAAVGRKQPKRPHLIRVVGRTVTGEKREIVIDRSRRYGGGEADMSKPRHVGRLKVSREYLVAALGLPPDCKILGVYADEWGQFCIGLDHPSLPAVEDNCPSSDVSMTIHVAQSKTDGPVEIERFTASWSHDPACTWKLPTRLIEYASGKGGHR